MEERPWAELPEAVTLRGDRLQYHPYFLFRRRLGTVRRGGGHVDAMTIVHGEARLQGWAADAERATVAKSVLVFVDGALAATTRATKHRPDVARAHDQPAIAGSGFEARFPIDLRKSAGEIRVRVVSWFGGDRYRLLPSRPNLDLAAYGKQRQLDREEARRTSGLSPGRLRCERCNVIVVSIDTLRSDRLGTYGYARSTSPYIDRFARQGVVFERFYHNGGQTLPSHMTMMTSLRPTVHGVRPDKDNALPDAAVTLAEMLRQEGYETAAFVDGGYVSAEFGFDQGFQVYDDRGGRGFAGILPAAREWVKPRKDGPFFLFLHTYDVHSNAQNGSDWGRLPYACPEQGQFHYTDQLRDVDTCRDGRCASDLLKWINSRTESGHTLQEYMTSKELAFISDLYDGCIRYTDGRLGRFFRFLRSVGTYETSLIIVTSDHGEEFGEHGKLLHTRSGYEELSRVPLIMKLPQQKAGGRRISRLAAMVDLMPTVADVVGAETPDRSQGRTLLPTIGSGDSTRRDVLMWTTLRTHRWKYFHERRELFGVRRDPAEQHSLWWGRPAVVARLRERTRMLLREDRAAARKFRIFARSSSVDISGALRRRLRALGYSN